MLLAEGILGFLESALFAAVKYFGIYFRGKEVVNKHTIMEEVCSTSFVLSIFVYPSAYEK